MNNRVSPDRKIASNGEKIASTVHRNDVSGERMVPLYLKLYSKRNDARGMLASIITGEITSSYGRNLR
jgi:hypothetical protein